MMNIVNGLAGNNGRCLCTLTAQYKNTFFPSKVVEWNCLDNDMVLSDLVVVVVAFSSLLRILGEG